MSNLKSLAILRNSIKNKYQKELSKNEEEIKTKIFKDLKVLTNLDFEQDDSDVNHKYLIATDEDEQEFIYLLLDVETLEIIEVDDQTRKKKYFDTINWYIQSDGRMPVFVLNMFKEKEELKNEIFSLKSDLLEYKDMSQWLWYILKALGLFLCFFCGCLP